MKQKFYICRHCGNIIAMLRDKGVPVYCCGEEMQEITPGTTEASTEKHIPVYEVRNGIVHVTVGSVEHPMTKGPLYRMGLSGNRARHSVCPFGSGRQAKGKVRPLRG